MRTGERGKVVEKKQDDMAAAPSLADIAAAMKVLQPEPKRSTLEANISYVLVTGIIGLAAWLLMGLNTMQQTVTQVSATVAQMSKQIDAMAQDAKDDSGTLTQMKENVARLDQRVDQNEQRLNTLDGRGSNGNAERGPQDSGTRGAPTRF